MSYRYDAERPKLFTDEGQRMLIKVRDLAKLLFSQAGAVRMDKLILGVTGDSWAILACADRLVEIGDLREIPQPDCAGQDRIFVWVGCNP